MTTQKVDEKHVNSIQTEIIDSQKRTISTLLESELVAANTGIALKQQGETLAKTKQLTHRISLSLHKSDRDIRAIKSWAGAIFNKFVKPGAGGRLSQENREESKNNKNERLQKLKLIQKYLRFGKSKLILSLFSRSIILVEFSTFLLHDYESEIAKAYAHADLSQELIDQKPCPRQTKKSTNEDEITENFNHIASSLNRLKTMSLEMGYAKGC